MSDRVLLEPFGPLSQSMLWDLQRRAYEGSGVSSWQTGTVPQYATTNPRFAGAYAEVLLGFLRDCRARPDHDPTEPIHIVELGAGPGRFGYHLLTELLDRRHHSRVRDVPIRYVLTDLADANVEFWLGHPHLAPLLDAGLLDVARFDAVEDDHIELRRSGTALGPGSLANPIAVIANYLFDSIPQDVLRVAGGSVVPLWAAATSSQDEPDLDDPDLMARVQLAFEDAPDGEVDPLVVTHYERLGDTAPLLFPTATLRCVGRLAAVADRRLLLLTGDKGYADDAGLLSAEAPEVVAHGSAFSFTVDFGAVGAWFRQQGGRWMGVEHPGRLTVSAGILGFDDDQAVETDGAYRHAVAERDPVDFFTTVLEREEPEDAAERILAILRISGADHEVLLKQLPALTGSLDELEPEERVELGRLLRVVWDRYFPIAEEIDLPYFLSRAFFELGDLPSAIEMLHHSVEIYGPTGWTLYNLAQCLLAAGEPEAADEAAAAAEKHPETAEAAAALRQKLTT